MAHQQLAEALGLPEWVVGSGYRYVKSGDAGVDRGECLHVRG